MTLKVGDTRQLQVTVLDEDGKAVADQELYFYSTQRRLASADTTGLVTAHQPGEANIIVVAAHPDGKYIRGEVVVTVPYPPVAEVALKAPPQTVYTGVSTPIMTMVKDAAGLTRDDVNVTFTSSNSSIASFDPFNNLTAHKKGKVQITATAEGISTTHKLDVKENPVKKLMINAPASEIRTGDVLQFSVTALGSGDKPVTEVPVSYTFAGKSDDPSEYAGGLVKPDGRFVAYQTGMYVVTARCGMISAQKTIKVTSRQEDVAREIELVGQGMVTDKHTSDLWVWEGQDGRDYAVTGTWGADGEAFFWDVTDPANIIAIDTIKVDARTVNDVKVSEDGKICVISREGASSRKNGIIILDVSDPKEVWILAEYTEGLTGGVHNLFIYKDHVYALSAGRRYDIINIEDPAYPKKVGSFELDTPGHSIHDVWVADGLAYSSNWHDGVQIVDVGNGIAGGSPSNPVKVASYAYPSGWNHAAFPFFSKSTGKFYVIAGDEAFPNGLYVKDKPTLAGGYLHVIDFTDMENPREVAKYEVPGAGSHNFWIEGETLYVANYNAGLRIVDISGDLLGDLFRQGREIGWFMPHSKKGVIPNAAMTWGPQPHKGYIFFSDWNSGLWSVKMKQDKVEN